MAVDVEEVVVTEAFLVTFRNKTTKIKVGNYFHLYLEYIV